MLHGIGIEKLLRSFFYQYGGIIARYPLYFVIIPVIVALGLGSGILFLDTSPDIDAESLYAPQNSQASKDRVLIEDIYYTDGLEEMLPQHLTEPGSFGQVIIMLKDRSNMLSRNISTEILRLNHEIESTYLELSGDRYSYRDLCMKWQNNCIPIGIVEILNQSLTYPGAELTMQYPFTHVTYQFGSMPVFLGGELAGITQRSDYQIEAKAIQLTYSLHYNSDEEMKKCLLWEVEFKNTVANFKSELDLELYWTTSATLEEELDNSTSNVIGQFSIAFITLIFFSVATCSMTDWVRSKTWLASMGVWSASLAVLGSFGLLIHLGVPFVNVVASAPFLVIGIGIDDMFLMIAAWRKTDVTKTTEQRMKEAFSEAAMSITITSITDALAFGIGAITPFLSIRIFCLYTGVAVLFDYLFQITFFAGCMALMGYREEKNLHVLTCRRVLPKDEAPSSTYRIFCSGGSSSNPDKSAQSPEATQHTVMNFFRNTYGPFLTSVYVIPVVIIVYLGYVAGSVYGITQLVEGLTLSRLAPDGSDAAKYYEISQEYFYTFGPPVAVVITEEVDYADENIQNELLATLAMYESSPYFHDCCSSIWLTDYLKYLSLFGYHENIPAGAFYGHNLKTFLSYPTYHKYSGDIVFDNTTGRITSSRFYVIPKDVLTSNAQKDMMLESRSIASKADIPMIAYSSVFPYYEQYVAVVPNTLQNLGIAVAAMLLVSIILLPSLVSSIVVCLSLVSVIAGIIGFMSLWNVSLDLISMINLIISIGFTIDFSAHIIYAYLTAPESTPRKRAIYALYTMGMPITQAASSTILAILVLATSDTYIFRCFFKVMFLVMVFGALHGLVFLPVFLMLFVRKKSKKDTEINERLSPRVEHVQNLDSVNDLSYYQNVHDDISHGNHRTVCASNI